MNDPATDVVSHDFNPTGLREFYTNYRLLIGSMQEALGETSAAVSNMVPGGDKKTATEIKISLYQEMPVITLTNLSRSHQEQMMFWHLMDRQFLFTANAKDQRNN